MSALELDVGVTPCIEDIISAFHDGGAVIEKTKIKCASARAPPPSRLLEETIDQAPAEIRRVKEQGVADFGKAFEDGDLKAVVALQKITIELQKSLLDKLKDDETKDFSRLVTAAEAGREKTIAVLQDLLTRLEAKAAKDSDNRAVEGLKTLTIDQDSSSHPQSGTTTPAQQILARQTSDARKYSVSQEPSGDESTVGGADDTPRQRKRSSLLGFLSRHHRANSTSGDRSPKLADGDNRTATQMNIAARNPKTDDLSHIISSPPSGSQTVSGETWRRSSSDKRRESAAVPPEDGSEKSRSGSLSSGKILGENTGGGSNGAPTDPTPENNYLGFCKNAFKLQTGDRTAMHKCKEFNDGWSQSVVYYLACGQNKCAFAGHVSLDFIWDKVYSSESAGVKFRWPFLAKSHVLQAKAKGHVYQYQCMFCVFSGESSPTFTGTDEYIAHLQQHRSERFGEVLLYKTKCIAGRIAEDTEEFDINIWPDGLPGKPAFADVMQTADDKTPRKTSPEAQDSVMGSEGPWNEGLSDFHWKDDYL